MAFWRMTGGFDLRKIEESSATRMSGLVQERSSDQFARFAMVVDEKEPHSITEWHLDAIATPAEFATGRFERNGGAETAKARIEELVKDDKFSGAVLVTKNGKNDHVRSLWTGGQGKEDPNSLNTKFRIGSMNKMFTAVSILQLCRAERSS